MKAEYTSKELKNGRKNPYYKKLTKQVSIRIPSDVVVYFKELSDETGLSEKSLMTLYLTSCANSRKRPKSSWIKRIPGKKKHA